MSAHKRHNPPYEVYGPVTFFGAFAAHYVVKVDGEVIGAAFLPGAVLHRRKQGALLAARQEANRIGLRRRIAAAKARVEDAA